MKLFAVILLLTLIMTTTFIHEVSAFQLGGGSKPPGGSVSGGVAG